MSLRLIIYGFLAGVTALRVLLLPGIELSPEEAYHAVWAERPAWGYHGGGPGVAVAMRAGMELAGHSELALRLFSPLLALATSLLILWLGGRMFSPRVGAWSVLLVNFLPGFQFLALSGLKEALSLFFWAAALAAFWQAVERSPKFSFWWVLAGLAAGLGFLCSFTHVFFPMSVLLFLAISRKYRIEFRGAGVYLLLGVFAVCTVPVGMWNSQNHWITFLQLRSPEGAGTASWIRPGQFVEFLGAHLLALSPLIFAGILVALVRDWRTCWRPLRSRFLLCFAAPVLLFFSIRSFYLAAEVSWTAPGFLALALFAVAAWVEKCSHSVWHRAFGIGALVTGLLMSAAGFHFSTLRAHGILPGAFPDLLAAHRGWESAATELHLLRTDFEARLGEEVFLIADGYESAAALGFYLPEKRPARPDHPPLYIPESQNLENQFSFLGRYDEFLLQPGEAPADPFFTEQQGVNPFLRRTALFVTRKEEAELPNSIRNAFVAHELIGEISIHRHGVTVRKLLVFACYNYQTAPL